MGETKPLAFAGEDQVEKLRLQGPIAQFVEAFVAKHFQPEPFKKRRRDKAHVSLRDAGRGDVRRRQSGDVFQTPPRRRDYQ